FALSQTRGKFLKLLQSAIKSRSHDVSPIDASRDSNACSRASRLNASFDLSIISRMHLAAETRAVGPAPESHMISCSTATAWPLAACSAESVTSRMRALASANLAANAG